MSKKIKILHLSSEKTWRGGEQQIAYLIQELKNFDAESCVALRKDSEFEAFCKTHEIPYVALPFKNEFDLTTGLGIKKYANEMKVDLVHIHTAKGHGLAVLATLLGMNKKLVLSKRTDFPVKNNFYSRFKFNHPAIKKILCVSQKIKEVIDPALKNPDLAIPVHSGVDISKFKFEKKFFFHDLLKIDHKFKLVGNTSAIAPHKDYFTFVKVAKEVTSQDPNVKFLIIGNGPLEKEIKAFVKELGLEDKVLFTGFIKNLSEVLFNLDVFLITSNEEGLGTSILDAHACHIPVVGTRAGGIPEIVIDGVSGTACAVEDVKCLSEAVKARLSDGKTFEAKKLVQEFTKEDTAKKTWNIYQSLL